MKTTILTLSVLLLMGCASMEIAADKDNNCTLTGWGSGEGTIDGKCSVKKSIFTFPTIRVDP